MREACSSQVKNKAMNAHNVQSHSVCIWSSRLLQGRNVAGSIALCLDTTCNSSSLPRDLILERLRTEKQNKQKTGDVEGFSLRTGDSLQSKQSLLPIFLDIGVVV